MSRECMSVLVCGMTAPNVLERLTEGQAVITPADRDDVVLAVTCAHGADSYPSLSCLILNGALKMHPAIAKLVSGLRLRLPIIATTTGTFETAIAAASARGRVTPASPRKIDMAVALVERHVNIADLLGVRLAPIPIPTVITPQMFTHQLLDRARADRKRIVLPEGSDDRILRAAGRLLRHRVVDLTILGDEAEIRSRAAELGVNLSDAAILDPRSSELCEKFVTQYADLREQGRHPGAGRRDHARHHVFRNHAGVQRFCGRDGVRRRPHHRAHRAAGA